MIARKMNSYIIINLKPAHAATCGNAICETADEEHLPFSANYCPGDCPCNQDWDCDAGEEQTWCSCDCGGFFGCGPFMCGDSMCQWGERTSCPEDCPVPEVCDNGIDDDGDFLVDCDDPGCALNIICMGGGGETDENDWLYIGPAGVMRSSYNGVDLFDYTYSE